MDPIRLKELLENPESATSEDALELESLVSSYPYFQAARVLLAKITGTSEAIKSAAAYTSDRTLLMRVINGTFDKDVNLPNLDDLEIGDEVNAFEHLDDEGQDETKEESSTDENIDALLKSFEEEAEEEETSSDEEIEETSDADTSSILEDSTQEEATSEDIVNDNSFENQSLSDFSTEDYNLPDYSFNFDSENSSESDDSETSNSDDNEELSWDSLKSEEEKENAFEDFDLKDISEEKVESEITTDTNNVLEDEDVFRNELMESLADLERIRKENASQETEDNTTEDTNLSEQSETEPSGIEKLEEVSIENEIVAPEEVPVQLENETFDTLESIEETQKHVIENIKKTETISDTSPMFDDNLFELNHLIDTDKQIKTTKAQVEGVHGQTDVIDRFINTIPELTAQDHESREYSHLARDLYDRSIHADTSKMTETMAKLMITQGKLPRAIEIYEHLMLKYPEKKAYFAALIEKIRKDI